MVDGLKEKVEQTFEFISATTAFFRGIKPFQRKSNLLAKIEDPIKHRARRRRGATYTCIIATVAASGYAIYRHGNAPRPPKTTVSVLSLDGLFFQSYVVPNGPTNAPLDPRMIFETLGNEIRSHLPDIQLESDVSYGGNGATLQPLEVTDSSPAYVSTRIKTRNDCAEFAFTVQFQTKVREGHFQEAFGASPNQAVSFEIAPDPTSGSMTFFAKQAGKFLPQGSSTLLPSTSPKGRGTTLTPAGEEFWIIVRIERNLMRVTIPVSTGYRDLTYKLPNLPELGKSTIVDRRSYGSNVLLKYFVSGTSEQVSAVISGSLKASTWPDLNLERDLRSQNLSPAGVNTNVSQGSSKRVATR